MSETVKWTQILVNDNCWRCGSSYDVRQAYNPATSEYGSEPKCATCRVAEPTVASEPADPLPDAKEEMGNMATELGRQCLFAYKSTGRIPDDLWDSAWSAYQRDESASEPVCGTCGDIHVSGKYYNHNAVPLRRAR